MEIKKPTRNQLYTIRLLILIGVIAILNFCYWFLDDKLIDNKFLYWSLIVAIAYSYSRIFYEWYHYWSISVPKEPILTKELTVDVLTTYFPGEPYDMILNTLEAIQKITYPHTTYLCDEANDPFLIEKCKELGVIHVTRDNRIDAKAGNINNALRTKATGEICVILDPDHVPQPDFLDPIIPHFSDDKIGYVQVVQSYKNLDESFVAKGAAQQTFQFYGPMMMCMNSYGTVNAIGANCTFRRAALDSIGGHAPGLSEDMHTAMQLFAKGWKSVYVPKVVARGLVPSTLTAYYKQQLKWSRGTLELLVSVYPKLFKRFNWRQKIHFGLIPMHYLAGVFYLINFLIPIIALLTSTTPWKGNVFFFGLIAVPVISSTFLVRHYVQRWVMEEDERGFHMVGGLLLISTWWIFILGLWYTIIRKEILYLPTPKDGTDKSSWKIIAPNIVIGVLSLFAIVYGLSVDWTPFTFVMCGFAFINAFSMFFTVYFSYHTYKKLPEGKKDFRAQVTSVIFLLKVLFWKFRHALYGFARKYAVLLTVFVLGVSLYTLRQYNYNQWEGVMSLNSQKKEILYSDIFYKYDTTTYAKRSSIEFKQNIIGVNYKKGSNWYKDNYVLTRKELLKDFERMKALNINTIKYQQSRIYDRNVLSISKEKNMNVVYNFWISSDIDFKKDNAKLKKLYNNILERVELLKDKENIIAWNLGNDVWFNLRKYYSKSELVIQREKYIIWLNELITSIKKVDSQRPVLIDVEVSSEINHYVNILSHKVSKIDIYGLVVKNPKYLKQFVDYSVINNIPYIYNDIKPEDLALIRDERKSLFVRNWQDQYENDKVSFDGLLNRKGLFYADNYKNFNNYYSNKVKLVEMPLVKIIKPAVPLLGNQNLNYHAMIFVNNNWEIIDDSSQEFLIEWNLIKQDEYKNPIAIKLLGNTSKVRVTIPKHYDNYRIELILNKNGFVKSRRERLNIPLIAANSEGNF